MKRNTKVLISFILMFLAFCLVPIPVKVMHASEIKNNVILLIDNSLSMQKTDPNRLSIVGASMLIDTLDSETNINIISFGERVISNQSIKDKPSHELLKSQLSKFNFKDTGTNLLDGLSEALKQLGEVDGEKTLIILSDGKEDIAGGVTPQHLTDMDNLIKNARAMKVTIHTIGLSSLADRKTLSNISFNTGGSFFYCTNPADLFDIYGKVTSNINDFYTINNYTTDQKKEDSVRISSFVDECIIKIASCENKTPLVDVFQDGTKLEGGLPGDKYVLYRIKNDKDTDLKITAKDNAKNKVIVQIKSMAELEIDTLGDSFQIPPRVPLNINIKLNSKEDIPGLHITKIEKDDRENIIKKDGQFNFTFMKEAKGQYPIAITAYDGENNIIAVRNIDVEVTDDPPFYYDGDLQNPILTGIPFKINLRQMDASAIESPTGDIIVDYGDNLNTFQLANNNGLLSAEIKINRSGGFKITASINGIYNNRTFSYYLPYQRINVIERPYIKFELGKNENKIKMNKAAKIMLDIKENLTYQDEVIGLFDDAGNKIGEFKVQKGKKGEIPVEITPIKKTKDLILVFKGSGDLQVTERIGTGISVLSSFGYLWRHVRLPLLILLILILAAGALYLSGMTIYAQKVSKIGFNENISYSINNGKRLSKNIVLNSERNTVYINLVGNAISIQEFQGSAIGYLEIKMENYPKVILGLQYLIKKEAIAKTIYNPVANQRIMLGNEEQIVNSIEYQSGIEINLQYRNNNINILFS